jgi:acyl dehydratase
MTAASRGPELAIGAVGEPWTLGPVGLADFVRYAGASGDFNPLHYDPEHARAAGFASVIAQGMFQAGVLASYATGWLGAAAVRRFQVRFVAVVLPGDTLTCNGTVVGRTAAGGEDHVEVELRCLRQTGDVVIRGEATFSLDPQAGAAR